MTHLYSAYGLRLESQVAIPGLRDSLPDAEPSGSPLISLAIGQPPNWRQVLESGAEALFPSSPAIETPVNQLRLCLRNGGAIFHLTYPDGAEFAIDAPTRSVWCWGPAALTIEDLATYIVGPVLGFILRHRGILSLHASCLHFRGHAVALCGGPRSVKSTLAAALALRSWPVLCEDITALREREGNFLASPGYPRVNLWPDSAAGLCGLPADLPRITPSWEKQFLPLDQGKMSFECLSRPLAAVYAIAPREAGSLVPRIERMNRRQAVLLLVQNTYMNYLLDKTRRAEEFDALVQLVKRVPVRRLVPCSELAAINAVCDLIEADLDQLLAGSAVEPCAKPASP